MSLRALVAVSIGIGSREPRERSGTGLPRKRVPRRISRAAASYESPKQVGLIAGLVGAAVAISVLAIGAVQPLWTIIVCILALAAGLASWFYAGPEERIPGTALICIGLAGFCLLQAMPLPLGVVRALSPVAGDIWARVSVPLSEVPPGWASLSLDPGATKLECLKWASYGAAFSACAWIARRFGARHALFAFVALCVLVAAITLGHALIGAERYLGFYEPRFNTARFGLAPLLNPNNLAGYLNLGTFCGIGLLLAKRSFVPRWVIGLSLLPIVGVSLLSGSRAGLAVFLVGAAVVSILLRRASLSRHTHPAYRQVSLFVPLAALGGGVILAGLGSTRQTWNELLSTSGDKLRQVVWAKPMLADFIWFGAGRGSFESVFPAYRGPSGRHVAYQYAENFLAQWAVEWGAVISLVALVAFAWVLRPRRLYVQSNPLAAASLIGVAALLVHNMVDLALEVPAVSLALAGVLGSLDGAATREERTRNAHSAEASVSTPVLGSRPIARLLAASVLVLCFVAVLTPAALASVDKDRSNLREQLLEAGADKQKLRSALREVHQAMLRHPADPFPLLVGALITSRLAEADPLQWLNRSLERDMENGRTHLMIAQVLGQRGARSQALMELRFAAEREMSLAPRVAALALKLGNNPESWLKAVPAGATGAAVLVELASLLPWEHTVRLTLIEDALQRQPDLVKAHVARGEHLLHQLSRADAGTCSGAQRESCIRAGLSNADQVTVHEARSTRGIELRARLLRASARPQEAEGFLMENCSRFPAASDCWKLRAEIAAELKEPARVRDAFDTFLASSCTSAERCASAALWAGRHLERHGQGIIAINYFSRAAQENPSREAWLALANAATRAGQRERARVALARANASAEAIDSANVRLEEGAESKGELQRMLLDEPQREQSQAASP